MKKFGPQKGKNEDYLIILFGFILVGIVIGIIYVIGSAQKENETTAPTPTPTMVSAPSPVPTTAQGGSNPPVAYDKTAQQILLDRKINRRPLSANDAQLKRELLALLPSGQIAGIIHETRTMRIEYIESLDLFKVEILTTNIAQAKDEANIWFRSQGMSQQGICDLPLGFYLNWEIANLMRNTDITFNPLPNGCQT